MVPTLQKARPIPTIKFYEVRAAKNSHYMHGGFSRGWGQRTLYPCLDYEPAPPLGVMTPRRPHQRSVDLQTVNPLSVRNSNNKAAVLRVNRSVNPRRKKLYVNSYTDKVQIRHKILYRWSPSTRRHVVEQAIFAIWSKIDVLGTWMSRRNTD